MKTVSIEKINNSTEVTIIENGSVNRINYNKNQNVYHISDRICIQDNKHIVSFLFDEIVDKLGTTNVVDYLRELNSQGFFINGGGLGQGVEITQTANQFDDLEDGSENGQLAYVENSQGTRWLPGILGGTYYPAGWYVWNGTNWVSDRNAIADQFDENINNITQLQTDLLQEITNRQLADTNLENQILSNDSDILDLQNNKADVNHTHIKADITDFNEADYATAAQGTLADSALQSGDNISELNNDVNYLTSFTETDPIFSASPAFGIAATDIANWNTAFSWGDHALAGYLTSIPASYLQSGDNVSELVNDAGYLTNETDPVFSASPAGGITVGNISNWNNAFSWGDHALAGYLTSIPATYLQSGDNVSELVNDAGYLTSFTETDPIFQASEASNFVTGDKAKLDNQSGINTGDETLVSIQTKRPLKTIEGQSIEGIGNIDLSSNDVGLGNVPNVDATDRSNHTGTQLSSTISDFDTEVSNNTDVLNNTAKRSYPLVDENKLAGVETGATADQNANEVPFIPNTPLTSTNVQDAIDEVQSNIDNLTTDHGVLTGLLDDDHPQYLNEIRHDSLPQDNPHGVNATQVGLGNVDNTSDLDKPISNLTQAALDQEQIDRISGDLALQANIDAEELARIAADTGTVTIHSDVSNAGSGEIITSQERIDINASVDVHNDSSILPAVSNDGDEVVIVGGQLVKKPRPIIINSSAWSTTTQDIDNANATNTRINTNINVIEAGLYEAEISFTFSADSTGQDFVGIASLNGQFLSVANPTTGRFLQTEGKDAAGTNPDNPAGGTNQLKSFKQTFPAVNLPAGLVNFTLQYGPSAQGIEANIGNIVFKLKRIYNVINL